ECAWEGFQRGCTYARAPRTEVAGAVEDAAAWVNANIDVPGDEREVLVFLNGDCALCDWDGRKGGGWGIRLAYFDHDKNYWRVHGSRENFVTHWQDLPDAPVITSDTESPSADAAAAPADERPKPGLIASTKTINAVSAALDAVREYANGRVADQMNSAVNMLLDELGQAHAAASQPALSDAAITACALMIKGICITQPNEEWVSKIEARIRFMLDQAQTEKGNHDE
ncbi:hypothetical protein DIE14_17085, partial [Burkholderia sp. Bp9017]|uniref:DUF551 domain-containing protein n=1 Tax=unclassified Burkholderia TaxID=2613784 RepID=UPI000F9F0880